MLMIPATPFEKFFSRWFVFTVVYLVVFTICYKLADYTRFTIYSLAYPEKDFIASVDLSHLVGDEKYYTLCRRGLEFGALISGYFFVQSLFVLGSSICTLKNSFHENICVGNHYWYGIFCCRCFGKQSAVGKRQVLFGGVLESKETTLWIVIVAGIFCVSELGTGLFPL